MSTRTQLSQSTNALQRLVPPFAHICMLATCAQALWADALWKGAEPRVMTIAREQYTEGLARSLTFSGMPFLEKPPLYFDLTAIAFHLAGGPSIFAARVVVALLAVVLCAAVVLVARRVGGARAGLMAGAALVVSPAFAALARRMGVDVALVSMLSVAMLLLFLAIEDDRERVDGRWFAASLVAAGLAALSKGVFGTFLFVAPTVAYSVVARDWRIIRALLRPTSLALLALPHVLWGLVLLQSGGMTYVFEHFVNNTIGRVLHRRFGDASVLNLAYGDVGGTYDWWYYLRRIPTSALPAVLAVPFAVRARAFRGGLRARDATSRLFTLCLCWGCVPPVLLSFSSYKGRGHLAASSAALVVIGALWFSRWAESRERALAPRGATIPVLALYALSPLLLAAGGFGAPATEQGMHACFAATGALLIVALGWTLRARHYALAAHALLAATAAAYIVDLSPAGTAISYQTDTMDPVSRWVAREVGDLPVALYYLPVRPEADDIGWSRENEVASLTYWLGRPVVRLPTPESVVAYLGSDDPGFFVAHRSREQADAWPGAELRPGWVAIGGNRDDVFVLVANRAAAALQPGPRFAPPDLRGVGDSEPQ